MDLSTSEKIREQLSKAEVDPRTVCDWNQNDASEDTMVTLKEMQLSLEGQMAQAIESHVLGKEKTLHILKGALPLLEREKVRASKPNQELLNLIEMLEVRDKIDYCLGKLESMLNSEG